MPTLLNAPDRDAILDRLRRLTPTATPRWGALTPPRLLCHLADQLRVALGDTPVKRTDTALTRTLLKLLVVYSPMKPPPGKVQTAPEMLLSGPTSWAADLRSCEDLIARLATTPTGAVHPTFGPLSYGGWGRLAWKHLDHHLRQFGL
jgi:hypothetical protein